MQKKKEIQITKEMVSIKMKKVYYLNIILALICFSCQKEIQKREKLEEKMEIELIFPDTVVAGNWYSGKIVYKNMLDTVSTKLFEKDNFRTIEYAYTGTKTIDYSIGHLKSIFKDTVYATNNRVIPVEKVWFGKTGTFYFDGIIKDQVVIKTGEKNSSGKIKVRIISDEYRLTKKVVVIDSIK